MQKLEKGFKSDGFVYQGGDPADINNWIDEEAQATESVKPGFEADGFVYKGGDPNQMESWLDTTRKRGFGETLNDYAITAGNAALGFGKAVSDAVAPDNFISQGIQALIDTGLEKRSDIAEAADLRRQRLVEDADSLGGEAAAFLRVAAENPGLTAAEIFGNLGLVGGIVKKSAIMASSRALAKGATKEAAEAAGTRAGTAVGVGLGGLGAGGDAAGTAFELVQQTPLEVLENDDDYRRLVDNGMKPEAAREELATRAARDAQLLPTIVGAAGGAFGFEKLLAGGKAFGGGALSRTLKSGAAEAVPEAFEEGLTTYEGQRAAAEYNPEIDPMKGVGAAAAAGGLFGGLGGGAAGLASPVRNVSPDQIAQAQSAAEAAELAIAAADLPLVTADLNTATDAYLGPDLTRVENDPNSVLTPMDENLPNSLVSVAGQRGIQTSDIEPGLPTTSVEETAPATTQPASAISPAVDRMVQQIQSNIATRGMATESEAKFLEQYAPGTQPAPTAAPSELPGAFTPTPELQGVKRAPAPEPDGELQQFISAKRQENTPAAQELVRQFDAGAVTPAELTQQMQTQRELANQRATAPTAPQVAQARIEEAAAVGRVQTDLTSMSNLNVQGGAASQTQSSVAPTAPQVAQARIEEAAAVGRMEQTKGTGKLVILPSLGRADENGNIELVPAELDAQGNTLAPAKTIKLVDVDSLSARSEVAKNDKGVVTSQTLSRDQFNAIQALVRPFGVSLQLYESDTAGDGFIMPSQRNKVFLNTKSSIQASSVVFHEMGHLMEREVPEAYASLKKVLVGQTTEADQKGFAQYYGSKEFMADELVGDSVGQLLSKPEMLSQVFEQIEQDYGTSKARGIIARLVGALNKALNTLLKTFRNNDFKTVGQFVGKTEQELQAVKAAVRDAAVAYARKQRGEAATVQGRMIQAERDISLTSTKAESVAETPDPIGANLEEAQELGQPVLSNERPQFSAARIIFEVAPDPNNKTLKQKWDSFDEIEKSRISQEVLTQVMPDVLAAANIKAKNVTGQIGGYLDDSNPSFTALFDSPKLQLGKVLEATKLAGFALAQDSMMVVADKPFEGSFETGFITLTLPKSVDIDSIDSVHEVYKTLRALDPDAIQGHTTVGREMGLAVPLEKMEALQKAIEDLPGIVFENPSFSTQYMAFPTKEDYDYGNSRKLDQQGSKLAEQQRGANLRARAEQALNEAFERRNIQPNVARSSVPFRDKDGNFVRRKLGLNPDPKGREINRVRQIAQAFDTYLKQMSGRPVIERDDYSTEARDELAQAVADEVAYQIKQNNSGLGWYSSNYPKAVKKLSRRFPELKNNENARMVFSALVAITSNGEEVSINAATAVKMYEQYRAGKPLREITISSRRADAMNATVQRFAELLERMSLGQARKYLMEEITVAQMNKELRALGEKSDGSYKADTVVPRSAVVLGPKIGAFFANLMGSEGYLTMDLWWTRSINRMRGLLIPEPTDSSIDTLRDLMNLPAESDIEAVKDAARSYRATYKNNNFQSDLELAMGRKEGRNDKERAAFAEEARTKFGKDYPEMYRKSRIQKAANTVLKTEDEINEAPANASDREFMYGVAREAQRVLKESGAADLSLADIQAALWYYEKKLYEALSGKKGSDIGYDEAINRLADQGEPVDAVRKFKAGDKEVGPKFSPARAVQEIQSYAETLNDSFFRTPTITDTKDMVEIGSRLGLKIRRRDIVDQRPHVREFYVVNFEEGREAYITVARRDVDLGLADGDVYINVGGLESGDEGGRVYMAAGALAFNRQLRLVGDPDGITEAGKRRRLENMIALALKYKTTSFFAPHKDMLGWNGLQWRGSDDQKTLLMLQSSYAVSSKLVPEIKNVTFDENTGEFRRLDDGSLVPTSAFVDMASRAREATPATRRDGMPGSGTLRLGVIYKSLAGAADPAQPVTAGLSPEQSAQRARALRDSTEGIRFSSIRSPLGFYNKLDDAVEKAPKSLKTGQQWSQWVSGGKLRELGVKQEEIEWSGLKDYLDAMGKEPVSLEDVQAYVQSNGVQVTEVTQRDQTDASSAAVAIADRYGYAAQLYGDQMEFYNEDGDVVDFEELPADMQAELNETIEDPTAPPTQYSQYTLPGGTRYREVLLRLPSRDDRIKRKLGDSRMTDEESARYRELETLARRNEATASELNELEQLTSRVQESQQAYLAARMEDTRTDYKSPHWNPENVLAHIRLNDRKDADGNKVLFVEELQSDWGQEGKKKGFKAKDTTGWKVRNINLDDPSQVEVLNAKGESVWQGVARGTDRQVIELAAGQGLPVAPFVTDTKGWLGLGLKRVISMAVQGGYDKVAFVTGQQSADRYDLRKTIDYIEYEQTSPGKYYIQATDYRGGRPLTEYQQTPEQLETLIGKELTKQIVAGEGEKQGNGNRLIRAKDFKMGGEGMLAFYDKIVPQEVRSLIKKFDGQLETFDLRTRESLGGGNQYTYGLLTDTGPDGKDQTSVTLAGDIDTVVAGPFDRYEDARDWLSANDPALKTQQPGFTITEKMREVVSKEGLPLFSEKRKADLPPVVRIDKGKKDVLQRYDEIAEAATQLMNGEISKQEYAEVANRVMGVAKPFEFVPEPATDEDALEALTSNKQPGWKKADTELQAGDEVGLRLDIPAYTNYGVWVNSIHPKGKATMYGPVSAITDAVFPDSGDKALKVAMGGAKAPFARVEGRWLPMTNEQAVARLREVFNDPDWIQVGYNPLRHSFFFDRATGNPVASADEVVQIGPLMMAKNAKVDRLEDDTYRFSNARAAAMDNVIYKLQDKLIDLKRLQQDITKTGKQLQDEVNAYQTEELYHGRSAKQSQDFLNLELQPLLEEMRMRKVDRKSFETFLWNRHAEERNIDNAAKNERLPDGGSGIKTADARAYLASLDPAQRRNFEALAARVDRMTKKNLDMMVETGLETQEKVNALKKYKYYVPLMRGESIGYNGTGTGYSITGATTRRSLGSDKPVEDILASLATQRDKIITRAEKARVGRAVMGLALQNPDDNVWFVFDPLLNDPKKNPRQREELRDQLDAMGVEPDLADEISQQPYEEYYDERTKKVQKRPNRKLTQVPNALGVRIAGEDKYVVFNQNNPNAKRMAESLANLDTVRLEGALGLVAKASRYFASINTQYNPVFGIVNLIRDVQGAMINLTSTKIAGKQVEVTRGLMPAMAAIYQVTRARRDGDVVTGEWADLYDRFQNVGAQTGFRDMFESARERTEKQLDRTLDPSVSWQTWQKTAAPVFDWLSDYNETLENAVRLSAFKTALDQGMTDAQAASVAKNLTVNFNRKGQIGTQAGAVYAFFNASVQGSARLVEALNGPKGRQIIGGGLLIGVAQTVMLAMAGYDDEEPPEFIKERNLVIPTGDSKYITIPMPLGLHVIPNLGRIVAERMMGRTQESRAESVARLFATTVDAFNPVDSSTFLQTIAPTVLDPAVALSENKDFGGKPIYREDFNPSRPTPGYTRARDNSIEYLTSISKAINYVTGGSDFTPGLVSPTPDQLEYIIGQLTGGVGRELSKVVQVAETGVTGEELPTYKVPLFGRLYGDRSGQASQGGQFYANLNAMHEHKLEITGRMADGLPYQDYLAENPEAGLFKLASTMEQRVQELRRRKTKLKEAGAGPETIRQLEEAITATMKRFNETVSTARGRSQTVQ